MSELKMRAFASDVRAVPGKDRTLRFTISDESVDRYNSIIRVDGWDFGNFQRNPVFLWSHDSSSLPVGRVTQINKVMRERRQEPGQGASTVKALEADVLFADRDTFPFADVVFNLFSKGFLRGVSVGFQNTMMRQITDPDELEELGMKPPRGEDLMENELMELSAVAIPGNANALVQELGAMVPAYRKLNVTQPQAVDESWLREQLELIRKEMSMQTKKVSRKVGERTISVEVPFDASKEEISKALDDLEAYTKAAEAWNRGTTDEEKRQGFTCPKPFASFDECTTKFAGEVDDPAAFCAAWEDFCEGKEAPAPEPRQEEEEEEEEEQEEEEEPMEEPEEPRKRNPEDFLPLAQQVVENGTVLRDYIQSLVAEGEAPAEEEPAEEPAPEGEETAPAPDSNAKKAIAAAIRKSEKRFLDLLGGVAKKSEVTALSMELADIRRALQELVNRSGSTSPSGKGLKAKSKEDKEEEYIEQALLENEQTLRECADIVNKDK